MISDKKRVQETFLELVSIYSPSGGEMDLAKLLLEKLSMLDITLYQDNFGNIIGRIPAKEGIQAPVIFFSAHLDVVEPCKNIKPVIEIIDGQTLISSDGTTVLGADDKAGLAMILEAITCIIENNLDHGEVELLLTLEEETGLTGAKAIDENSIKSIFGYVLDHSEPLGTVINRAPQHENLTFTFKGKASHSGLHPESGISAILLASKAISNMPIGRLDDETTANVGTIKGGVSTNIIPDKCVITCEVRSHDVKKLTTYIEKYVEAANEAVKEIQDTSVNFSRETEYRNIYIKPNEQVLKYAEIAANKLDLPFKLHCTNGGSDANVFNYKGITCVCLGCGYNNPHATSESITVENLALGADYMISIIQSVIQGEVDNDG